MLRHKNRYATRLCGTQMWCSRNSWSQACRHIVTCSGFPVSIFIIPYRYSHFQLKNLDQGVGKFKILLVYTHCIEHLIFAILTSRINTCAIFLFSEINNVLNSGIQMICLGFSTLTQWCHTSLGNSAQLTHLSYSMRIDPRSHVKFTAWTVMMLSRNSSKKSVSLHQSPIYGIWLEFKKILTN